MLLDAFLEQHVLPKYKTDRLLLTYIFQQRLAIRSNIIINVKCATLFSA